MFVSTRTAICGALFAAVACHGVPSASAEQADGKALYQTRTCVACHGRNGAKAIQTYPQLAGLGKDYLYEQMKAIAAGERLSGPDARGYPRTQAMKDVMSVVTDDELKTIAAWLSTQPAPPIAQGDPGKIARGAEAYASAGCPACHGDDGQKPLEGFPIVAGQKRDYLLLQIKEIRDGVRKNGQAPAMAQVIEHLSDADAEAIAEYLSSTARAANP
jgi:cytochrome c553